MLGPGAQCRLEHVAGARVVRRAAVHDARRAEVAERDPQAVALHDGDEAHGRGLARRAFVAGRPLVVLGLHVLDLDVLDLAEVGARRGSGPG